ncbi:hypothetical protein AI27_20965 [Sphingomonas sp. BHC-A]|nr:hypothetical protein AI27_20965 [Sphingomonas sp. BHC-A]
MRRASAALVCTLHRWRRPARAYARRDVDPAFYHDRRGRRAGGDACQSPGDAERHFAEPRRDRLDAQSLRIGHAGGTDLPCKAGLAGHCAEAACRIDAGPAGCGTFHVSCRREYGRAQWDHRCCRLELGNPSIGHQLLDQRRRGPFRREARFPAFRRQHRAGARAAGDSHRRSRGAAARSVGDWWSIASAACVPAASLEAARHRKIICVMRGGAH